MKTWDGTLALDGPNQVYLAGHTLSADFPDSLSSGFGGVMDAFVTKFNASNGTIVWSSYLGGSYGDRAADIVCDVYGDIIIFGDTESADFPLVNPFDGTLGGGNDAFITKLRSNGSGPVWSTFLGGSGRENEYPMAAGANNGKGSIALDNTGVNIVVGGQTFSLDFPASPGAFQQNLNGTSDGYLARIAGNGAFEWASYLGGSDTTQPKETVHKVAVNPWNEVFAVGRTDSINFPVTAGALKTSMPAGRHDGFLTKVNDTGTQILYSTYLGGNENNDVALGIDYEAGNVAITGWAMSSSFPITAGTYQPGCVSCSQSPLFSSDGFVLQFLDAYKAHDGFESGNYTGGTGDWTTGWTVTGDISNLNNTAGPHSGKRHVRLRRATGYLRRTIDTTGMATAKLGFWYKVESFEGNDRAYVRVKSTLPIFTEIFTLDPSFSNNKYRYQEIDVTTYLPGSTTLQVEFDAEMNATNDNWYLDDIRLVGTESSP